MSSASIFRRSTNQPAIPNRRACAKQEEILLMQNTTTWRTTAVYVEHGTVVLDKIDFELATGAAVLIGGEYGISLFKPVSFKAAGNVSKTQRDWTDDATTC